MILSIIAGLIALSVLIYLFLISNFNYWEKLGVNGPKPAAFVGNYPNFYTQNRQIAYDIKDIYESYKNTDNFVGIYIGRNPQLLITDPEMIRRVFTTDFKHFHDNELSLLIDDKSDFVFGMNPFTSRGEEWKQRRSDITPGLTGIRIKAMFETTKRVCKLMTAYIDAQIKIGPKDGIDCKDLATRFTSEIVMDNAWGLEGGSFNDTKTSTFREMLNALFDSLPMGFIIFNMLVTLIPSLRKYFKTRFVSIKAEKYFSQYVKDAVDIRKSQLAQGLNANRVDYMNHLMQLQEKKNLSIKHLTANSMTFIFDGYETTAGVLSHTLLLLGRDLQRQQRLRLEILENLNDSHDDFDMIMNLPYLDACIHESLRIFPALLIANKVCTEPIELTNKNGKSVWLSKDIGVVLPLHSVMTDSDIYKNPESFEPERFLSENGGLKKYKDMGVYYGFGDGPRACLGMRFALAQLKGSLVEIVRHFEVVVNPKTRKDNLLDPIAFLGRLQGGIWLDFKRI